LKEQRANVYENKGGVFNTLRQSGNVYENKGTYELSAGKLLKRKEL
jgi:hypothetical protein